MMCFSNLNQGVLLPKPNQPFHNINHVALYFLQARHKANMKHIYETYFSFGNAVMLRRNVQWQHFILAAGL